MGEVAEPRVGDLPSSGDLLALLHHADAAFDQMTASHRVWSHGERVSAARLAQVEQEKRRGGLAGTAIGASCGLRPVAPGSWD
jgi:hypothetical protein